MMDASTSAKWQDLAPSPTSCYQQLFVKGTRIRSRILYGMFKSVDEPMTPEQIAAEFDLPVDAVKEAIAYCQSNPPEIAGDFARGSLPEDLALTIFNSFVSPALLLICCPWRIVRPSASKAWTVQYT